MSVADLTQRLQHRYERLTLAYGSAA